MRRALRLDAATAIVLGLTVVGLALRVWGIQHGLPHPTSRPDEREVLDHTAQFATGDLNPRWFIYPPFYFHVTWLWDEAVLAVWRLWRPRAGYFELLRTNLAPLLLAGRLLTAALGAATVPITWAIGRRLGGTALGLVATALVAVCYLLVRDSHALKPDVPIALGVLVSLWLLACYVEAPSTRLALWAGLSIGATTAFKYNGVLLLIPAYVADLASARRRFWPTRSGWVLLATGVASFLLLDPHMVTDFARTYQTYLIAKWNVYVTRPEAIPPADAGWLERAWIFVRTRSFGYHLAWSLRRGCGLAIALATPLALVATLRRGAHPMLRLSAFFAVLYFVVAGGSPVRLARYFTPIVPILLVLVADLLVTAARAVPARWRTAVIVLATCALAAEPLANAVGFDRVASQTDTRVLAADWLAHQPSGTVVAIAGTGPFPEPEPVLPPNVRRVPLRLDPAALARDGVAYVVAIWHDDLGLFANGSLQELGSLAPALRLVQEFSPFAGPPAGVFEQEDIFFIPFYDFAGVVRPGPVIRVYAPIVRS